MDTIMALKPAWSLLGCMLLVALYAIGGYLNLWKIRTSKSIRHAYDSFKMQPDGSFSNPPYGMVMPMNSIHDHSGFMDRPGQLQSDGSFNNLPYGMGASMNSDHDHFGFMDSSAQLQPDGSFNNLPYGIGTSTNSDHDRFGS
jgi:hypothetical protein